MILIELLRTLYYACACDVEDSEQDRVGCHRMETINFLLDRPVALIIVLAIGAVIGATVERTLEGFDREKRKAYWRGRNAGKFGKKGAGLKVIEAAERSQAQRADTAADQLKTVMAAKFSARPLLNRSEAAVFKGLDAAVIARNPDWQVMAQVSLGGSGAVQRTISRQPGQGRILRHQQQARRFRADGRQGLRAPRA